MTTAYCSPAELRTAIDKTGSSGSASDAALNIIINAASGAIDGYFNRPSGFFLAPSIGTAKLFTGKGKDYILVPEFISLSKLEVKDSPTDSVYVTWAATDYILFSGDPVSPNFNDTPYNGIMTDPNGDYSIFTSGQSTRLQGFRIHPDDFILKRAVPTVRVTAKWGFSVAIVDQVKQITIALSARWYKRGQSSWADVVAPAEMGNLIYSSKEYNDIKLMLDSLRLYKPVLG